MSGDDMSEHTAPYGRWTSKVTPEMLTEAAVGLVDVWHTRWVPDGEATTVWLESRPSEGGRATLVALSPDGGRIELLPATANVRSGVHEYGGGAAWVEDGTAWYTEWTDQRLYRLAVGDEPVPLTPEPATPRTVRHADLRVSPDGAWVVCVRETHGATHGDPVVNELVALRADVPSVPQVVFTGTDFVSSPRFVGGDRLRWIAWDHPNMPWNDTTLYEATFDPTTGTLGAPTVVGAGESFMQPVGDLVITDRSNWWNVWRLADGDATPLFPAASEMSGPAWVFGDRDFVVADDGRVAWAVGGTVFVDGVAHPTAAAGFDHWTITGAMVTAIARFVDRDAAIVSFHLDDVANLRTVVPGRTLPLEPDDVSCPEPIVFPTPGGIDAHGWYYSPTNSRVTAPDDQRPPLVVMIHGGPTSDAVPFFSLAKQFWTSRGFAVVDVNHRGSTGHGRAFRDLLDGEWGVVDVEDCCAAATWLAGTGRVDADRLVIRGGSAGGFTVLASLARADVFAAGASSYGIADLSALAADTHKFEARYCDRLIGPWPEAQDLYAERSPIHHLDGFDRPLIVFQGLDDMVVPPSQSEMIVTALRTKGVECEYHAYEGEGHGFRKAGTIVAALSAELAFYQRVLDL